MRERLGAARDIGAGGRSRTLDLRITNRTWTKACCKATLTDIAARHVDWMVDGEPENRGSIPAGSFNPYPMRPGVPMITASSGLWLNWPTRRAA